LLTGPIYQRIRSDTERYWVLWKVCTLCPRTLCNWKWLC